jgi:hypothetical protein
MIATFQSFATADQPINLGLNSRGPRGHRVRVAPRLDVTGLPGYSPTRRPAWPRSPKTGGCRGKVSDLESKECRPSASPRWWV